MKDVLVLFPSSQERCAKWQPTYWPPRFFQRSFLRQGDLHNYRFFLNQQPIRLDSLPAEPLNNLVPDFRTEIDPAVDPKGFALATFMHQNSFLSITEQLGRHWKPVALAFDWDQGRLGGCPHLFNPWQLETTRIPLLTQRGIWMESMIVWEFWKLRQSQMFRDFFSSMGFAHENPGVAAGAHRRYDKGGWSPLCFAAMNGDPVLVSALLEKKASPNDATKKSKILATRLRVEETWWKVAWDGDEILNFSRKTWNFQAAKT